jgi:malate synthase
VTLELPDGVELTAGVPEEHAEILSRDALAFLADLHRTFDPRRRELLEWRAQRQAELDGGALPSFLRRQRRSVRGTGASRPHLVTWTIDAWRSPARQSRR